jgi:transcription initiation factor TFIIB
MSEEINVQNSRCDECNSTRVFIDPISGEIVCKDCGFVVSSTILNLEPEWRAFDQIQKNLLPRVGAPATWTIHDKGLSTTIGFEDKDFSGRQLNPEERARVFRLRKWDQRSKIYDSTSRNLTQALNQISSIGAKINLPKNTIETSSMIYRRALQSRLIRGRTIQSMAVASIYLACRQCGVTRSLKDIAAVTNITVKEAARNYRFLCKMLKPKVPRLKPSDYIGKIVNKLELSGETEHLASKVLENASKIRLTVGRSPQGIAAACIYISTNFTSDQKTQSEIAKEAQVTEVTIRNRYKDLIRNLFFNITL